VDIDQDEGGRVDWRPIFGMAWRKALTAVVACYSMCRLGGIPFIHQAGHHPSGKRQATVTGLNVHYLTYQFRQPFAATEQPACA